MELILSMSTNQVDFGNEDWLGSFLFAKTISLSQIFKALGSLVGARVSIISPPKNLVWLMI